VCSPWNSVCRWVSSEIMSVHHIGYLLGDCSNRQRMNTTPLDAARRPLVCRNDDHRSPARTYCQRLCSFSDSYDWIGILDARRRPARMMKVRKVKLTTNFSIVYRQPRIVPWSKCHRPELADALRHVETSELRGGLDNSKKVSFCVHRFKSVLIEFAASHSPAPSYELCSIGQSPRQRSDLSQSARLLFQIAILTIKRASSQTTELDGRWWSAILSDPTRFGDLLHVWKSRIIEPVWVVSELNSATVVESKLANAKIKDWNTEFVREWKKGNGESEKLFSWLLRR